ncbi:MAG: hypothetical protein Q8M31_01240 [Beijerinckiaceae bacterium]|nr:hypothetical protein [Beijerinckiaceae bacterium]
MHFIKIIRSGALSPVVGQAARFGAGAAALAIAVAALASMFGALAERQPWREAAQEDAAPQPIIATTSAWTELPDAQRRFVLRNHLFGLEPDFYAVRRNAAGGGRLDQMAFGSPFEEGPYLRVGFYTPADEPVAAVSFWLEMARRSGEAGFALERAPFTPDLVSTRLGSFEVGSLTAVGPRGARPCLGFRLQSARPNLIISGLACIARDASEIGLSREALVCALEAVSVVGPDDDLELKAFFEGTGASLCRSAREAQAGG